MVLGLYTNIFAIPISEAGYHSNIKQIRPTFNVADEWNIDFSKQNTIEINEYEPGVLVVQSRTIDKNTNIVLKTNSGNTIQGNDCILNNSDRICKQYYLPREFFISNSDYHTFSLTINSVLNPNDFHSLTIDYYQDDILKGRILTELDNTANTQDEMFDFFKTVEMSSSSVRLNENFDENNCSNIFDLVSSVMTALRTQKQQNNDIIMSSSIDKISTYLNDQIDNSISLFTAVTYVASNIQDYIVLKEKEKIIVEPPMVPQIGSFSMPILKDSEQLDITVFF